MVLKIDRTLMWFLFLFDLGSELQKGDSGMRKLAFGCQLDDVVGFPVTGTSCI